MPDTINILNAPAISNIQPMVLKFVPNVLGEAYTDEEGNELDDIQFYSHWLEQHSTSEKRVDPGLVFSALAEATPIAESSIERQKDRLSWSSTTSPLVRLRSVHSRYGHDFHLPLSCYHRELLDPLLASW